MKYLFCSQHARAGLEILWVMQHHFTQIGNCFFPHLLWFEVTGSGHQPRIINSLVNSRCAQREYCLWPCDTSKLSNSSFLSVCYEFPTGPTAGFVQRTAASVNSRQNDSKQEFECSEEPHRDVISYFDSIRDGSVASCKPSFGHIHDSYLNDSDEDGDDEHDNDVGSSGK